MSATLAHIALIRAATRAKVLLDRCRPIDGFTKESTDVYFDLCRALEQMGPTHPLAVSAEAALNTLKLDTITALRLACGRLEQLCEAAGDDPADDATILACRKAIITHQGNSTAKAAAQIAASTFAKWHAVPIEGQDGGYIMQGDHCIAECDEWADVQSIMVIAKAAGLA